MRRQAVIGTCNLPSAALQAQPYLGLTRRSRSLLCDIWGFSVGFMSSWLLQDSKSWRDALEINGRLILGLRFFRKELLPPRMPGGEGGWGRRGRERHVGGSGGRWGRHVRRNRRYLVVGQVCGQSLQFRQHERTRQRKQDVMISTAASAYQSP